MSAQPGDNSGISPERETLFYFHLRKYRKALAAKKATDAAMKNCGRAIKADLGEFGLDELKDYETAQTPEGQERLKLKSEALLRSLRMSGMPVGTQLDIFEDRAPIDERAYLAGKEAGMRGDTLSNPYNDGSEAGQAFSKGWHEGQDAIFAIEKLKLKDEAAELLKGPAGEDPGLRQIMDQKPKRGRKANGNGATLDTEALAADAGRAAAEADAARETVAGQH